MIRSFDGTEPEIHESAYVDPTAVVIGDVSIGPEASVWPNATLRGDHGAIVVGEGANVQDNAVLHEDAEIGPLRDSRPHRNRLRRRTRGTGVRRDGGDCPR